ncbi:MAG TPA: hypothetical protein VGZ48_09190 [Candidatus Acidoferrales bacterium]|jgi:hypothetical protein|nr:hypothetical protein [Candidatus Acidoferrales bacterium]
MAGLNSGTLHLSDEELVRRIEDCTLEAEFHHADHIRLAWIYLRMLPEAEAAQRMASTLRRYSAHKGKPERYHHTMTLAWVRLVDSARRATPEIDLFVEFIGAHTHLTDQRTLVRHYSQLRLDDPAARAEWLEPDIEGLPS